MTDPDLVLDLRDVCERPSFLSCDCSRGLAQDSTIELGLVGAVGALEVPPGAAQPGKLPQGFLELKRDLRRSEKSRFLTEVIKVVMKNIVTVLILPE